MTLPTSISRSRATCGISPLTSFFLLRTPSTRAEYDHVVPPGEDALVLPPVWGEHEEQRREAT